MAAQWDVILFLPYAVNACNKSNLTC